MPCLRKDIINNFISNFCPKRIVFHIISLSFIIILFGLTFWQVERKKMKEKFIAQIQYLRNSPLVNLSSQLSAINTIKSFQYYGVEGKFVFNDVFFVFSPSYGKKSELSGPGYWIFVPFLQFHTSVIFPVNIGFIPLAKIDHVKDFFRQDVLHMLASKQIKVMARPYSYKGIFAAQGELDKNILYGFYRNDFSSVLGNNIINTHYFQLTDALPLPKHLSVRNVPQEIHIRNNHLSYALTWFSLGLSITIMYVYLFMLKKKEEL